MVNRKRARARTLNEWRGLIAAEEFGTLTGGTQFGDTSRSHSVRKRDYIKGCDIPEAIYRDMF
ncbi:hypothetical protein BH24ACI3_BH24ACI3_13420 [soil metagenome]